MSSDLRPSGHNKQYFEEETALLIQLITQGLPWPQIVDQFNMAVASDRQRNINGLRNKWRQLNSLQHMYMLSDLMSNLGVLIYLLKTAGLLDTR